MTTQDYTINLRSSLDEELAKISAILRKPISDKVLVEILGKGIKLYSIFSTLGWKQVGQAIVYGDERLLGFNYSAQLSGELERYIKRMKKAKVLDENLFAHAYAYYYLSTFNTMLKDKRQ